MKKGVMINHQLQSWDIQIKEGDIISILFFEEEISDTIPTYEPLQVMYEDDHILIVNKPAGMDTHPNEKGQVGTLLNLVTGYCKQQGLISRPKHIHRLDRHTTGGVIFAKHTIAGVIMDRLLTERKIKRVYMALVHGVMKEEKGVIHQ